MIDKELGDRIDKFAKEVESAIALQDFKWNDSFFINNIEKIKKGEQNGKY